MENFTPFPERCDCVPGFLLSRKRAASTAMGQLSRVIRWRPGTCSPYREHKQQRAARGDTLCWPVRSNASSEEFRSYRGVLPRARASASENRQEAFLKNWKGSTVKRSLWDNVS